MCDLNWCSVCDKAISCESDSLYCSMKCFQNDANNHYNHNFHHFLVPKSCFMTCSSNTAPSTGDVSDLSSTYTNSTYSSNSPSPSIFTRRAELMSRGLLKLGKSVAEEEYDDDEELACCDYCENLKSTTSLISSSHSYLKPDPFFIPPINNNNYSSPMLIILK